MQAIPPIPLTSTWAENPQLCPSALQGSFQCVSTILCPHLSPYYQQDLIGTGREGHCDLVNSCREDIEGQTCQESQLCQVRLAAILCAWKLNYSTATLCVKLIASKQHVASGTHRLQQGFNLISQGGAYLEGRSEQARGVSASHDVVANPHAWCMCL